MFADLSRGGSGRSLMAIAEQHLPDGGPVIPNHAANFQIRDDARILQVIDLRYGTTELWRQLPPVDEIIRIAGVV